PASCFTLFPYTTLFRSMLGFFAAFTLPVPWIILNAVGFHGLSPTLIALATGVGILGAAFVLSWGAEVLEMDVSQALALAVLALIDRKSTRLNSCHRTIS